MPVNDWPTPPAPTGVAEGQLVRRRKVTNGVRIGGAEPMVIVAETRRYVIYRVWSSHGRDLGERVELKSEFDATFERGAVVRYFIGEDE